MTQFYVACFVGAAVPDDVARAGDGERARIRCCRGCAAPRRRCSSSRINLIGLGLGPYTLGLISDATGDLRLAMLSALAAMPLAVALFVFAARRLPEAEASLLARARAAGEAV